MENAAPAPQTRLEPLANFVLLRPITEDLRTKAGLHLPPKFAQMQETIRATVEAVGPGSAEKPMPVKPGDVVVIQSNAGVKIEHESGAFIMSTALSLLAVERKRLELAP